MITIYPGNVGYVEFNAHQIYALITKLVDEKDQPISEAKLEDGKFFEATDSSGDLQIDIRVSKKEMIFKKKSGEKCKATLINQKINTGFLEIPKLVCKSIPSIMEKNNKD
jgi:outer membrane usher protein FimD/PapC